MRIFLRILVFAILMSGISTAGAVDFDKTEVTNIKEYQEYFNDYTQRLYDNFHPEKHFFFGQGEEFLFFINRDGTIEHLDTFFRDNRFSKYGKKLILNTPPYPFPKQIKDDKIFVSLFLYYSEENKHKVTLDGRNESYCSFYWKRFYNQPSINVVDLHIEKDCRRKHKN